MNFWIERAHAAKFTLGLPFGAGQCPDGVCPDFNAYFTGIVNFAIVIAGLLAVLVIVYAGLIYTQSQGQADKVSYAKELIAGALTGLALLLMIRLIVPTLGLGQRAALLPIAYAEEERAPFDLSGTNLPALDSWENLLAHGIGWLAIIAALATFAGIIYSGIMIITAGGDPAQAARAKNNLLWAIAGLLIAVLAYIIVLFVFGVGKELIAP
jgi:hypothetical protein